MELTFFSPPQGHNALPQPGLEPESSDLESSALTTDDKSSTLYGRTVIHPNFSQLDGLLLFSIIMGLCSASSAITIINIFNLFGEMI